MCVWGGGGVGGRGGCRGGGGGVDMYFKKKTFLINKC